MTDRSCRVLFPVITLVVGAFLASTDNALQSGQVENSNKGEKRGLIILHTNDIHGHLTSWRGWEGDLKDKTIGGLDRLGAVIQKTRQEHPDRVLLLDAGDYLGDTMIADLTEGKALLEVANHLKYDALTIGNHEPDFGSKTLRQWIEAAKFPVLAANVVERPTGKLLTKPYVVRKVNGITVGILGLGYPKTDKTTSPKNVADLEFQDPVAPCEKYLPLLRKEGAEIVIALTHLGLSSDKNLAESVKGIDVIVGGHSHNRMHKPLRVGDTLIIQAGAHGSDVGRLELTVEKGKVTDFRYQLIPLDHARVPSDPDTAKLIDKLLKPHSKQLDEVVGQAKTWLVRAQTIAGQEPEKRDAESPIDSLFADILRAETGADVALLPGVGYGVGIPPGKITAAQLRQMVPHRGKVVKMKLTGAQVREILEQAVENVYSKNPKVKVGGMIQVSGLRFTYDPERIKGKRVQNIEKEGGKWSPETTYQVATNSMLAHGGHNYKTFLQGTGKAELGSQYEMIRDWFQKHSPVSTPSPGRIQKVSKDTK